MSKLGHSALTPLVARPDYLAVAATRRKAAMPGLVLQARPWPKAESGPEGGPTIRVGITASRKVGKAVTRNRARRRLRALARDVLPSAASDHSDYVLIARSATADRAYAALKDDLLAALTRVRHRIDRADHGKVDNRKADNRKANRGKADHSEDHAA